MVSRLLAAIVMTKRIQIVCEIKGIENNHQFVASILLFESIGAVWMLQQMESQPNHTSCRKFYFNELDANVLRLTWAQKRFSLQPQKKE